MQLSDLWAEIGRLLSDPNNDRWPQSVLTSRINIAQTEIQGYTNAVKTTENLTPVANQETVSVNANTMDIVFATKTRTNGDVVPLDGITLYELNFRYPNWKQWSSGEPIFFWWDESNLTIHLAPVPDSSNAIASGITLYESRIPTALSASTDIPFGSNSGMVPFHMAIPHWVTAQCFLDNADKDSIGKAIIHRSGSIEKPGEYEKWLKRIMERFDVAEMVPASILWKPEGGRVGSFSPTKSYPLR